MSDDDDDSKLQPGNVWCPNGCGAQFPASSLSLHESGKNSCSALTGTTSEQRGARLNARNNRKRRKS